MNTCEFTDAQALDIITRDNPYQKTSVQFDVAMKNAIRALEERKEAHWIYIDELLYDIPPHDVLQCSNCGEYHIDETNYCENCGARMLGVI